MKKWLVGVAALLIAGGGAWYALSPALAMQDLKQAALAGDREELKERVDFPALRESLKSRFHALMAAEIAKEGENSGFAALGMAFASAIVDPMIDGLISPDGIKAMVENGRMKGPNDAPADTNHEVEWSIERKGFDRFIAHPKTDNAKAPSLVFKRDGLGWDLVDIEIPEEPTLKDAGV